MFQVGDHHPHLHVWNLYNNHEVRRVTLPHFQLLLQQVTQTDRLCCFVTRFNRSLYTLVESQCSRAGQPCLGSLRRSTAVGSVAEGDNDMVPLKPGRDTISKPSDTVSMSPMVLK